MWRYESTAGPARAGMSRDGEAAEGVAVAVPARAGMSRLRMPRIARRIRRPRPRGDEPAIAELWETGGVPSPPARG